MVLEFLQKPVFSVVTPTFNRRMLLERLYRSLTAQTSFSFEWIVVDDGSSDGTEQFVRGIAKDAPFKVEYIYQANAGKHVALNRAASAIEGDYCVVVDSDDTLQPNAIAVFLSLIASEPSRAYIFGVVTGGPEKQDYTGGEARQFRYSDVFRSTGDRTRLISAELYRAYPFPVIQGERFLTEAAVWLPMHSDVDFIEVPYRPVVVEYQTDGLSAKYKRLLIDNPRGSFLAFRAAFRHVSWTRAYFKFLVLHLMAAAVGLAGK